MRTQQPPADHTIHPRPLSLEPDAVATRWWLGGNQVATAFFNALSASFPLGERFFMDSVRHYRDRVDPRLREEIKGFISQEAMHTREHLGFNRQLSGLGYDLTNLEFVLEAYFARARALPAIQQLAATAAFEHFTAILAHDLLTHPEMLDGAPPEIARLWLWHAIEEVDHKSVTYDTYLSATREWRPIRRWFLRCALMAIGTILFFKFLTQGVATFYRQDKHATFGTWLKTLSYVLVSPGPFRRVVGVYLSYYLPGFHPWQVDDRYLIAKTEPTLALAAN